MKRISGLSLYVFVAWAGIGGLSSHAWAQVAEASLPDNPSSAVPGEPSPAPAAGPERAPSASDHEITWKSLPRDFLHDQKEIWLFPMQLARGRYWVPTLAVAGITAGLIYADPHVMPYFRDHATNWDDFNDTFDAYITTGEIIAVPASLMTAGYIRGSQHQVSTAILCAKAYADGAIVNLAIKAITRRQRPTDVPPGGDFHNTFFDGGKSPFHGSSFPSGHANGAFSVATVVAMRYQRHRWVPWAAYGMATAISLSRITNAAHFPSDVFLGAALGYSIARYQAVGVAH